MAFLVASATRQPAVFVAPPLRFWAGAKWNGAGRAGISSGEVKGHHAMRGRCVADFAAMYGGRVPLVTAPLRDNAERAIMLLDACATMTWQHASNTRHP